MKFVEVENSKARRNGDVLELCSEFLKSGIEVAEVTEIGNRFKDVGCAYTGIRNVVRGYFKGKMRVAKNGEHIYLERLGK